MPQLSFTESRAVVVAIDHPLYSWPVHGLVDKAGLIQTVVTAGADALITTYGTLRDHAAAMGNASKIMKLDLTTLSVGAYYDSEYRIAWTIEDAAGAGADAVLTYVQVGSTEELDALAGAARVAAAADRAGLTYVCEIMPIESARYPDPFDPEAIAACVRTAAELGAHVVKTSMPSPPDAIASATTCGVPVVIAGGDLTTDRQALIGSVRIAVAAGAAGVAFGRNVWAADDPAAMVRALRDAVSERPRSSSER